MFCIFKLYLEQTNKEKRSIDKIEVEIGKQKQQIPGNRKFASLIRLNEVNTGVSWIDSFSQLWITWLSCKQGKTVEQYWGEHVWRQTRLSHLALQSETNKWKDIGVLIASYCWDAVRITIVWNFIKVEIATWNIYWRCLKTA